MSTAQAQQTWQSNSEFAGDGDVLEEGDVRSGDQTGITAANVLSTVIADPNCSAIEILSFDVFFGVAGTHDGSNNHDIVLRTLDNTGAEISAIAVNTGTDFSNITAANSPVHLKIPPQTLALTANTVRIQLRYNETGTAPLNNPSVFIRYRKVFGNNPAVSNATLAV